MVRQVEVTKKQDLVNQAKNTVNVCKLVGAGEGLEMVIASIYDQKPFYILSNACDDVRKEYDVYHQEHQKRPKFLFID